MSKKSRQDLLVKVRYLNPIPPPPFPPKLFNIPTNIHRLGEPSYLDHLASSTPLPMLVDSEMGMPLNLNNFDNVWKGEDDSLNPTPDPYRQLDPVDQVLLAPMKPKAEVNGDSKAAAVAPAEVSWMRTGNLFSRKAGAKKREATAAAKQEATTDASVAAQIMTIDKTFRDLADSEPEQMRHPDPRKKELRVIETYDLLPDMETWGNQYLLLKFPEQPSETSAKQSGAIGTSRLSKGVLRPIRDDDVGYMELYLPNDENVAVVDEVYQKPIDKDKMDKLKDLVEEEAEDAEINEVFPNAAYDKLRMYEVHSSDKPKKEFILTIDERPAKRRKGAYYKDVPTRTTLRKTKHKDIDDAKWTRTRVGFREEFEDETTYRKLASEQVRDPAWVGEQLRKIRGVNMNEGLGEAIDDDE